VTGAGSVAIAGGGIAGLTTGLAFARKGWQVRVYEQRDGLRGLGAGIYIFENGLRVLEALGVLQAVVADAIPAWRHEKRNYDGTVFARSRLTPDFRLYVPLRESLLAALYQGLIEAGGEVMFNARAVAADPKGQLTFADGSATQADLVVGADGINSAVRDGLRLLRWRRAVNQFGFRALIRRDPGEQKSEIGRAHCENWNGSRRLLYAPCSEALAYVQLTSLKGDAAANRVPIDRDFWRSLFPRLAWVIDRIPDDDDSGGGGRGDWFELIRLRKWAKGRVALVGDSASGQPPFLGQGGGCAMMCGFTLAETVDRAGADVIAGIAEWQRRERRFVEWVQRVSYWYGQLALLPPGPRTAVFRVLDRSELLKSATLLVAARRDATAAHAWYDGLAADSPYVYPLLH
jgi:2-polyprenyl-6-methoxyphenol hydroxylase-like FAD-dependent oxidoreductase